ncbi:hypothetical protein [Nonomuraea sp. NPDC050540]|uniref:hypothetical protein n=1 Tax=Nonomuraea sp. NPDC050540 TaxID=3364367 RepID=UPI00379640A3
MTNHRISLWGAPGSGKTTFLAALPIAMMRNKRDWALVAKDDASGVRLASLTAQLVREREFPKMTNQLEVLDYVLLGPPRVRRRGWFFRRATVTEPAHVDLSIFDLPGGAFGNSPTSDLIDDLTASHGLLFLFDPIREFQSGDSFDYFYGVLSRLAQRVMASDASSARLPHRLAVCITKFDDPRVLNTAERLNLIATDPDDSHQGPRVSSDAAEELFRSLCTVSASGNADMLLRGIRQFFRPEQVRFFATSAIGFYIDQRRQAYDSEDFQNIIPMKEGHRIRGSVQPINVLEPILWLADQPAADVK